jgi:uncharacterized protein YjbJ (UPF0337 family)
MDGDWSLTWLVSVTVSAPHAGTNEHVKVKAAMAAIAKCFFINLLRVVDKWCTVGGSTLHFRILDSCVGLVCARRHGQSGTRSALRAWVPPVSEHEAPHPGLMYAGAQSNFSHATTICLSARHGRATEEFRSTFQGETTMNKDQIQGSAKNFVGKVQEETGKLFGSKRQQLEGLQKQVLGRAERSLGNAREITKDAKPAIR